MMTVMVMMIKMTMMMTMPTTTTTTTMMIVIIVSMINMLNSLPTSPRSVFNIHVHAVEWFQYTEVYSLVVCWLGRHQNVCRVCPKDFVFLTYNLLNTSSACASGMRIHQLSLEFRFLMVPGAILENRLNLERKFVCDYVYYNRELLTPCAPDAIMSAILSLFSSELARRHTV